ncbi:MAG TPA: hypothetical protein VK012_04585, partial [Gemmatimonadales bacterium]|nr:hypothetical protein [Gemmatimonadales bacterium]
MIAPLIDKAARSTPWLASWAWQRLTRDRPESMPTHLIIALADHFEPAFMPEHPSGFAPLSVQEERLDRWCREYPAALHPWRDADGRPLQRTYFYPAEQYVPGLIDRLQEHCAQGWGEIELHLHHGMDKPDTSENTRRTLAGFRDRLVEHGCLSRLDGEGPARFAFVHGNWALANSAGGHACGVDDEMQILQDLGCFADFTLPSAPDPAQVVKINSLYECRLPLDRPVPHRRGRDLEVGTVPATWPLIVQGPLGLNFDRLVHGVPVPQIENSALTTKYPPSMRRLRIWRRANITVAGRPEWVFVKLHCHGMDPRDESAMIGPQMQG